jgi:HK97 gp10 family phage protein
MARGRNLSVDQFQQLLASIPDAIKSDLDAAVKDQAERLAATQRTFVKVDTGNLKASIRVEKGRKPLQYLVKAGGPLTTKTAGGGKPYDYSRGSEFGTVKEPAHPFFFPTYRLMKNRIKSGVARKIRAAIGKVVPLK